MQGESIVTKPGRYGTLFFSPKDVEKPVVFFPPGTRATIICGSEKLRRKFGFAPLQDAVMGKRGKLLFFKNPDEDSEKRRAPPLHPDELPPGLSLEVVAVPGSGA